MTIHAIYTRATRAKITSDNPLGWTPEWVSMQAILDDARALKAAHPNIGGITIQRFAGSLPNGRIVGARKDESIISGMTVGAIGRDYLPTDDDFDIIKRIRDLGLSVCCYVGPPAADDYDVAMAILEWPYHLADLAVDMSGVNLATRQLLNRVPFVVEPFPRPEHRMDQFPASTPSITMAGYWKKYFLALPPPPCPNHCIAFNAGDDHNAYDPVLATNLHNKGYSVAVPRRFVEDFVEGLK